MIIHNFVWVIGSQIQGFEGRPSFMYSVEPLFIRTYFGPTIVIIFFFNSNIFLAVLSSQLSNLLLSPYMLLPIFIPNTPIFEYYTSIQPRISWAIRIFGQKTWVMPSWVIFEHAKTNTPLTKKFYHLILWVC